MAIPWSSPTYSRYRANRDDPPQTANSLRQDQVQKLDRASRLLLGALLEAHDILQSLQTEVSGDNNGKGAVNSSVEANIERVKKFAQEISNRKIELKNDNHVADISPASKKKDTVPVENNDMECKASDKKDVSDVTPVPKFVKSMMPDLVQNVQVSDVYVPNKNDLNDTLPDLLLTKPTTAITPRKKSSPKKYSPRKKKVFKLTTLEEMQTTKTNNEKKSSPLSWREAGAKLSDLAKFLDSPRRPSLPNVRNNTVVNPRNYSTALQRSLAPWMRAEVSDEDGLSSDDEDGSMKKTDILISSVVRAVQAVGLFLIFRKVENMFQ